MEAAGWEGSIGGAEVPCADHLSSEKEKKYCCIAMHTWAGQAVFTPASFSPPSPVQGAGMVTHLSPKPMFPSPRAMFCSLNEPSPAEPSLPLSHCTSCALSQGHLSLSPLTPASAELQGSAEMQFLREVFPTPHLAHLWAPGLPITAHLPVLSVSIFLHHLSACLSMRAQEAGLALGGAPKK